MTDPLKLLKVYISVCFFLKDRNSKIRFERRTNEPKFIQLRQTAALCIAYQAFLSDLY